MLPAKYKIREREVFELLKKEGASIRVKKFVFVFLKKEELANSKFGFVVSKKINKRAVVRNRIRRILQVALKKYLKEMTTNYYGLFIVREDISGMKAVELNADIEKVLGQAGII